MVTLFVFFLANFGRTAAAPLVPRYANCTAVGAVEHQYTLGGCKPIIFFYARGSTETFNMAREILLTKLEVSLTKTVKGDAYYSPGPPTAQGLVDYYGCNNIAIEGIDYAALLATNLLPGGADPVEALAMKDLLIGAEAQCPNSTLLVGGYRYTPHSPTIFSQLKPQLTLFVVKVQH